MALTVAVRLTGEDPAERWSMEVSEAEGAHSGGRPLPSWQKISQVIHGIVDQATSAIAPGNY